jgi:excisionase family DNA binding protein
MNGLAIPLGADLVHTLAERAAEIVLAQMEDRPEYMGTEEIAAYLGWPKKRIDNLCCERRIPFHKDGGRRLFIRQEIDEWAKRLDGPRVTDALQMAL